MKTFEFYFWYRYGDNKDHDTKLIESVKTEAEAWEKFNAWVEKGAGRPVRIGIKRDTIEVKEI